VISRILKENDDFGKSKLGRGKKIMIEFAQPNTHKAFHVGHLKSAISGFALVRLYENLGYDVVKANYFGDIGMQVAKTTWGYMNLKLPENLAEMDPHQKMKEVDKCYGEASKLFNEDENAEKEIRQINKDIYEKKDTEAVRVYKLLRGWSLEHQNFVWQSLGIKFDREYPESEIFEEAMQIVDENKGTIFQESEGAWIYDGEEEGLTTWVFETSEGNPTYSSKDLALAKKKFEEYPTLDKSIVTTSVEQADYFKVIIRVLEQIMPKSKGKYFHKPFGWMLRGGKKFSSRMGESIKGMDILAEVKYKSLEKVKELGAYTDEETNEISEKVANAGLKFLILSHEFHKDFSYDIDAFLSFQGFSGPYLLYSFTRARSILRKSENFEFLDDLVLEEEKEISLVKALSQYEDLAVSAGIEEAPHLVANYLYELAQKFNQFYTEVSVLNAETENKKQSRLALTAATAQVIKNGLNLLGIETVEKM
jgi:arginyl-tRNA synthetase